MVSLKKILFKKLISLLHFVAGDFIFLISQTYARRKITNKLKDINNFYHLNKTERKNLNHKKLVKIVEHCYKNIPFYNNFYAKHKIDVSKLNKDPKYFEEFPKISKDELRKNYHFFFSNTKQRFFSSMTGGSTGQSLRVFFDTNSVDVSSAITIYCRSHFLKKNSIQVHFASSLDKNQRFNLNEICKSIVFNRFNIFYKNLDNYNLKKILAELYFYKPTLLHGHPSILYSLACYVEDNEDKDRYKNIINIFEPSGEMLENYMKKKITEIFQCKIINRYGLAEFGVLAYQFSHKNEKLKILDSNFIVEPDKYSKGKLSEIVATNLDNFYMPLIKYKTGDLAEFSTDKDGSYNIENIYGRIHDFLIIDGKKYSTHILQDILDHKVQNIRFFQINLKNNKTILNLVMENADFKDKTIENCKIYLPKGLDFRFIEMSDISLVGHRAKFRHIVE